MDDLISVIVPVYNVEKYLPKCINSLINQTYRNIEIYLIDDGSTDESGVICDNFSKIDDRITVIHKDNGGQGSARNMALDVCSGDFLCFVDSDDFVCEDYVEYLYQFLISNNLDISCCNCNIFDDNYQFLRKNLNGEGETYFNGIQAIESMWYHEIINIAPWGKLYKKVLWDNIRFKECFSEDFATMHYIYIMAKKVGFSYEAKLNYLVRKTSDIHSFNPKKLIMSQIANDNIKFGEKYGIYDAALHKAMMVNFHILLQLPKNLYAEERNELKRFIRKNRILVLRDKRCAIKTKCALLLSYFGYNFMGIILKFIKKNNDSF